MEFRERTIRFSEQTGQFSALGDAANSASSVMRAQLNLSAAGQTQIIDPNNLIATDEQIELRAMVTALQTADGFLLQIAQTGDNTKCDRLVEVVHQQMPSRNIQVVAFDAPVADLIAEIKGAVGANVPDVLFVFGLELSIPREGGHGPLLDSLQVRWRQFEGAVGRPMVLWLPPYAVKALAEAAPEFYRMRGGVYQVARNFAGKTSAAPTSEEYPAIAGMSKNERKERVIAVRSLLDELRKLPEGSPSKRMESLLLGRLGMLYFADGRLPDAKVVFERCIEMDEATYGPNHKHLAIGLNNLGQILKELGDLRGAKKAFERALQIDQTIYGPDHPKVATRLNNLGRVLHELGDVSEAHRYYEKALAVVEKAFGEDHPAVAIRLSNLASLLIDVGDLESARSHLDRARVIDEKAYGSDHPRLATDFNNLGRVLHKLGYIGAAIHHFEQALRVFEKTLGPEHAHAVTVRNNIKALKKKLEGRE